MSNTRYLVLCALTIVDYAVESMSLHPEVLLTSRRALGFLERDYDLELDNSSIADAKLVDIADVDVIATQIFNTIDLNGDNKLNRREANSAGLSRYGFEELLGSGQKFVELEDFKKAVASVMLAHHTPTEEQGDSEPSVVLKKTDGSHMRLPPAMLHAQREFEGVEHDTINYAEKMQTRLTRPALNQQPITILPITSACSVDGYHKNSTVKLSSDDVELVVNAFDEDISWLADVDMKTTVYLHNTSGEHGARTHCEVPPCGTGRTNSESNLQALIDATSQRRHPIEWEPVINVGDEASSYLLHIIDKYDDLAPATVFLHGHRSHWHSAFDMAQLLGRGCFDTDWGYMNLNSGIQYAAHSGCIDLSSSRKPAPFMRERIDRNWHIFQKEAAQVSRPEELCLDCCSQFVVSRETIRRHSRRFYTDLLHAVLQGSTTLEFEWRFIFNAVS